MLKNLLYMSNTITSDSYPYVTGWKAKYNLETYIKIKIRDKKHECK